MVLSIINISKDSIYQKRKTVYISLKRCFLHIHPASKLKNKSQENFTLMRNILLNKSENPESLKKKKKQLKNSLTNMVIVGKDLLRTFCKLFYLEYLVSNNQRKNLVQQRLYVLFERHFNMKIIVTLVPTDLVTNQFLFLFCSFL